MSCVLYCDESTESSMKPLQRWSRSGAAGAGLGATAHGRGALSGVMAMLCSWTVVQRAAVVVNFMTCKLFFNKAVSFYLKGTKWESRGHGEMQPQALPGPGEGRHEPHARLGWGFPGKCSQAKKEGDLPKVTQHMSVGSRLKPNAGPVL